MKMLFERIGRLLQELDERRYPQEVPVEKAMPQAMMKMMAGRKFCSAPALARAALTNSSEPSRPVMFFKEVAMVRMRMAGTIATKPPGMHSIAPWKVTCLRAIR